MNQELQNSQRKEEQADETLRLCVKTSALETPDSLMSQLPTSKAINQEPDENQRKAAKARGRKGKQAD